MRIWCNFQYPLPTPTRSGTTKFKRRDKEENACAEKGTKRYQKVPKMYIRPFGTKWYEVWYYGIRPFGVA
jgi:hypothetical protein